MFWAIFISDGWEKRQTWVVLKYEEVKKTVKKREEIKRKVRCWQLEVSAKYFLAWLNRAHRVPTKSDIILWNMIGKLPLFVFIIELIFRKNFGSSKAAPLEFIKLVSNRTQVRFECEAFLSSGSVQNYFLCSGLYESWKQRHIQANGNIPLIFQRIISLLGYFRNFSYKNRSENITFLELNTCVASLVRKLVINSSSRAQSWWTDLAHVNDSCRMPRGNWTCSIQPYPKKFCLNLELLAPCAFCNERYVSFSLDERQLIF